MSDPGLTSEQRAAIAVHNATQNRVCLNLSSGNGRICVPCSEVADQIDAAVEVERQRSQAALAAARREADAVSHTRGAMMGGARHGCGGPRNWSLNGHVQAFCWRCEEAFHGSRAALAAPAAGEEGKRCHICGKPATCLGQYDNMTTQEYACDDCCGHGNEDGQCEFINAPAEDA